MTSVLTLLLCASLATLSSTTPDSPRDQFQVHVSVDEQHVTVVADLDYRGRADGEQEISFYLPRTAQIDQVECAGLDRFEFASDGTFVAEVAHALTLVLDAPLAKDQPLAIHLEYEAKIPGAFEGEWVEFFADHNFAPWHTSMARAVPNTCRVTLDRADHQVFAYGDIERDGDVWILRSDRPCGDVPWVAYSQLEVTVIEQDGIRIEFAHVGADPAALERLAATARWALGFYNDTFAADAQQHQVRFVIRPTERSLGYARPGYIVLAGSTVNENPTAAADRGTFAFVAHELGHLWWSAGDPGGDENWLNESFAEYASMLALRERYGQEAYDQDLASKRAESEGLPPVIGIERTNPASHRVFYRKGPVLLHELQAELGEDVFLEFWIDLLAEEVTTTTGLLDLLNDIHGDEVAAGFEKALRAGS